MAYMEIFGNAQSMQSSHDSSSTMTRHSMHTFTTQSARMFSSENLVPRYLFFKDYYQ